MPGAEGLSVTTAGKAVSREVWRWGITLARLDEAAMLDADGNTRLFDELVGRWNFDGTDIARLVELALLQRRIEGLEKSISYEESLPGRMAASGYATLYTEDVAARRESGLGTSQSELAPLLERRQLLLTDLRKKMGVRYEKDFQEWIWEQSIITAYYDTWHYNQWSKEKDPLPPIEHYKMLKKISSRLSEAELALKRHEWHGRFERVKEQARRNDELWRKKKS